MLYFDRCKEIFSANDPNIANQRPLKSYSHFGPGGAVNNVGFEELANVLFMTIFRIWRPGTG